MRPIALILLAAWPVLAAAEPATEKPVAPTRAALFAAREQAELRQADANADGYLSAEEMQAAMLLRAAHFERLDFDRDGRLSYAEAADVRRRLLAARRVAFVGGR